MFFSVGSQDSMCSLPTEFQHHREYFSIAEGYRPGQPSSSFPLLFWHVESSVRVNNYSSLSFLWYAVLPHGKLWSHPSTSTTFCLLWSSVLENFDCYRSPSCPPLLVSNMCLSVFNGVFTCVQRSVHGCVRVEACLRPCFCSHVCVFKVLPCVQRCVFMCVERCVCVRVRVQSLCSTVRRIQGQAPL